MSTFPEKFKNPQNAIGSPVIAVSMTSQQLGTTGDRCYNSVQRRHRQVKLVANEYNEQVLTAHKVSFLGILPWHRADTAPAKPQRSLTYPT